jgi:hypothetical protein
MMVAVGPFRIYPLRPCPMVNFWNAASALGTIAGSLINRNSRTRAPTPGCRWPPYGRRKRATPQSRGLGRCFWSRVPGSLFSLFCSSCQTVTGFVSLRRGRWIIFENTAVLQRSVKNPISLTRTTGCQTIRFFPSCCIGRDLAAELRSKQRSNGAFGGIR